MMPIAPSSPMQTAPARELADALREWWAQESSDWDSEITGADPNALPGGASLWDGMPLVDSKAITRSSPIFQQYLGKELDVRLIRRGGYETIEDAIADLVPKMLLNNANPDAPATPIKQENRR